MSFTSMTATVAPVLAETAPHESGVNPYLVGAVTLVILLAMLLGLLMFGAGRDHS
ncbi:MAG: hypothetical protein ACLGH4_07385 [Actinomycetes bacterium]